MTQSALFSASPPQREHHFLDDERKRNICKTFLELLVYSQSGAILGPFSVSEQVSFLSRPSITAIPTPPLEHFDGDSHPLFSFTQACRFVGSRDLPVSTLWLCLQHRDGMPVWWRLRSYLGRPKLRRRLVTSNAEMKPDPPGQQHLQYWNGGHLIVQRHFCFLR